MNRVNEELDVLTFDCPFYKEVNSSIEKFIDNLSLDSGSHTLKSQGMVRWIYNNRVSFYNEQVGRVIEWITGIINDKYRVPFTEESSLSLRCVEMWGVKYEKNSYLESHIHPGYNYTFSYNVNVPEGSSSLIFTTSGCEISTKPGQLIIFDSKLKHYVPPNNTGGRCVLVGNYVFNW